MHDAGDKNMGGARAVCPVCSMLVSRETRFASTFKQRRYYFCCKDCKAAFDGNPFMYMNV
ncbi:MAG: YHS domain-containing protein [Candidatus Micrarchaeota archaeon]|nr:YHS domain-containing protein [Candidatus Micrarchaeota archaeon]